VTEPTGPQGSDATPDRPAKSPKQRSRREERRESYSRTEDSARETEAGGRAYEAGGATVRHGLDASVGAVERFAVQLQKDAEIIGGLHARIAALEVELGQYRKAEKKTKAKVKAKKIDAAVERFKIQEYVGLAHKLGPLVVPAVLPELLPLVRRGVKGLEKLLPPLVAAATSGVEEKTPRGAAMRLAGKLYAQPTGEDEDADERAQLGQQTLEFLRVLSGPEDWPLVQEFLVSMVAQPEAAPATAPH
jgi:hypothetical protein